MGAFGVGFLGAGPVAQAIHLPTIGRFTEQLKPVHFMDVDLSLVERLARRYQASWTTNEDELIRNPEVEIVVVGSPNSHHARQVIKCCEAGKKVVLAEKPLAVSIEELAAIREASTNSGTRIVVGTMHAFDEAYLEALELWNSLGVSPHSIEVSSYLPANEEFVDLATQLIAPTAASKSAASGANPSPSQLELDKVTVSNGILGLAMHDIPLIREFAGSAFTVDFAAATKPWGYLIHAANEHQTLRLLAKMPGAWEPVWTFRANSRDHVFELRFKPSYVHAGSCIARITTPSETFEFSTSTSPYESEWSEILHLAIDEKARPRYSLERIENDAAFALSLVEQSIKKVAE